MAGELSAYGRRVRGCLLGGALGDALGKPVEFSSAPAIAEEYGPAGITDPPDPALLTDDTQMTLFTAEGLIRASVRRREMGFSYPSTVVWHAYLRWLSTQGVPADQIGAATSDNTEGHTGGWLVELPALHHRRAPGKTCLSALQSGRMGTVTEPINDSKGCGGVMRAAPAGLCRPTGAFALGRDVAAITHGHPAGYDAAGALALLIERLAGGDSLQWAVRITTQLLASEVEDPLVKDALGQAVKAAERKPGDARTLAGLGEGWVAEEALAIAVYCALSHPRPDPDEFSAALRLATNHGGDSDSTAALTGNILGAAHGAEVLPAAWLGRLELRTEMNQLADDMVTEFSGDESRPEGWTHRYPPS